MFDFFFKKKKIVLDCFTSSEGVYEYAKINYGKYFVPDWFKKTDVKAETHVGEQLSIKSCRGLINLYDKSIIVPSWFTLNIHVHSQEDQRYDWFCSDPNFINLPHDVNQFKGFALEDGVSFKIHSPWKFKTKQKIYFVWSQPTWSMRNSLFDYTVLPGVLHFYNQFYTNINLFFKYGKKTINIEPLDPLVMLHPLTENTVELKCHLVSEKKYDSITDGIFHMLTTTERLKNTQGLIKFRKNRDKIFNNLEKINGK